MKADEGTCRGCGAAILWIRTPQGKRTPIDAAVKKIWIAVLDGDPPAWTWILRDGHESHFATCPQAAEFRKGRG